MAYGADFDGENGHHEDVVVGHEVKRLDVLDLPHFLGDEAGFFFEFAECGLDGGFAFFDAAVDGLPGLLVFAGVDGAFELEELEERRPAIDVDCNTIGTYIGHDYSKNYLATKRLFTRR